MPVGRGGAHSSMVPEEGPESLDSIIKQAIGREHLLPFSRTADSPVQWIQLLHGLDQPDLHGWPFLAPRIELQKCEKCSRKFCSPINYRRHIRVHRRNLNANMEYRISRDILAAFWDKLSWEEAEELMSFKGVMLKEVPAPKIIDALASSLRTSGIWSYPETFVKAGSTLLDVIQTRPSGLPKSYELFRILDTAAEGTFLCAGTAESVGKHVFEGASVNSLELKNLVASTAFLFELQLVKAWFAEKDAEALILQDLLMEEEEAAHKRQADILEKKRQKKLRRKEHRVKEIHGNHEVSNVVDSLDTPISTKTSDLSSSPPDLASSTPDIPSNLDSLLEPVHFESDTDIEAQLQDISQDNTETIGSQVTNVPRQLATNRWQVSNSQRTGRGGSRLGQNHHTFKRELAHQQGPYRRNWAQKNGGQVWTKKYKGENDVNSLKSPVSVEETTPQIKEKELKSLALEDETTSQIEETKLKPTLLVEETTPHIEETKLKASALEDEITVQIKETGLKPPALEDETTSQETELKPPALEEETTPNTAETESKPPALEEETTPQIEETASEEETTQQFEETELKPPALEEKTTFLKIGEILLKTPALVEVTAPQIEETECDQVMIGSIPIVLKSCASSKQEKNGVENVTKAESLPPAAKRVASKQWRPVSRGENKSSMPVDKDNKNSEADADLDESLPSAAKRVASKQWRPVSRGENKSSMPVDKDNKNSEADADLDEAHDQSLSAENCTQSESTTKDFGNTEEHLVPLDGNVQAGSLPFSSATAEEFLARRWKEAILANHVTLELSSPPEPGASVEQNQSAAVSQASNTQKSNAVGNAENKVGGSVEQDQSAVTQTSNTQKRNAVGNAENKVGGKGKPKYRKNKPGKEQQKVK